MKIYNNLEQRSAEWHSIKSGKFSGSDFYICMSDKETETKKKLIYKKAVEVINGYKEEEQYINNDMLRGVEQEEEARKSYELETGNIVNEVGFIEANEYVGCSPDGLIGEDGILEIKCPNSINFLDRVIKKEIPFEYQIQIQFNLFVSNRKWCDFVNYNKDFKKSLLIQRVERDEEVIKNIQTKLNDCIKKVNEIVEKYNNFINKKEEIPFLDNLQDLVKEEALKDEEKSYNRIIK